MFQAATRRNEFGLCIADRKSHVHMALKMFESKASNYASKFSKLLDPMKKLGSTSAMSR